VATTAEAFIGLIVKAQNQARGELREVKQDVTSIDDVVRNLAESSSRTANATEFLRDAFIGMSEGLHQYAGAGSQASQETQKFSQTQAEMDDVLRRVSGSLSSYAGPLGRIVSILGVGGTVGGAFALGVGAIGTALAISSDKLGEYYERLRQVSELTGISVDNIITLQTAAANSGRGWQEIEGPLSIYVRRLDEAAHNAGEAREAFRNLGVTVEGVRDPFEVLLEIQKHINEVDAQTRNASLSALVGGRRGVGSMLALLEEDWAEAARMADTSGTRLTEAQKKVADEADKTTDRMGDAWKGLRTQMSASLAESGNDLDRFLTSTMSGVRKWYSDLEQLKKDNRLFAMASDWAAWMPGWKANTPSAAQEGKPNSEGQPIRLPAVNVLGQPLSDAEKSAVDERRRFAEFKQHVEDMVHMVELGRAEGDAVLADLENQKKREFSIKKQNELWEAQQRIIQWMIDHPPPEIPGTIPVPPGFSGPPLPENLPPQPPRFDMVPSGFDEMERWKWAQKYPDPEDGTADKKKKLTDWEKAQEQAVRDIVGAFHDELVHGLSDAIFRAKDLKEALFDMMMGIAQSWFETGLSLALSSIGLQSGATLMQSGGVLLAQQGVMLRGVRGADTQDVKMGRGETILDHSLTDGLRQMVADRGSAAPQGHTFVFGPNSISMPISGLLRSVDELDELVPNEIAPRLARGILREVYRQTGYQH